MANVLHLLATGNVGGIETLVKDIGLHSRHNTSICIMRGYGAIVNEMIDSGLSVEVINARHYDIRRVFMDTLQLIDSKKIDIVVLHHQSSLLWMFLPYLKQKRKHIKIVLYVHAHIENILEDGRKGYVVREWLYKKAYKCSDKIIAISESVKNSYTERLQIPDNKVAVVYNGIETSRFLCSDGFDVNHVNVIYVGRLIKNKGMDLLLQIMKEMKAERNIYFYVVGDGECREHMELFIEREHLKENVHMLGTRRDIPFLLSKANIFIHPAICREGFGITIVEAMASGLVCIVPDSGAMPELIDDKTTGYIVERGNVSAYLSAIRNAIEAYQTGYASQIRKNAIRKARTFDISVMMEKIDGIFDELNGEAVS